MCSSSHSADVDGAPPLQSSSEAASTAAGCGLADTGREHSDAVGSGPGDLPSATTHAEPHDASGQHEELSSDAQDSGSDGADSDLAPGAPSREERKAHKKAVKEAARERRKTKMPKHVKKRATKHK